MSTTIVLVTPAALCFESSQLESRTEDEHSTAQGIATGRARKGAEPLALHPSYLPRDETRRQRKTRLGRHRRQEQGGAMLACIHPLAPPDPGFHCSKIKEKQYSGLRVGVASPAYPIQLLPQRRAPTSAVQAESEQRNRYTL